MDDINCAHIKHVKAADNDYGLTSRLGAFCKSLPRKRRRTSKMSIKTDKDRLAAIIEKYQTHPEFLGIDIIDPNQPGALEDTLLHLVARLGVIEDIAALVDAGADVNAVGDLGNTPLHQAAMMGKIESVVLLLKLSAKSNLKNEFKQTALDVAKLSGREEVIQLFKF